ncbi:MAG: hypothetical protein IJ129_04365, partial [Ruminococcus sp.]|nr:hypothetical protein [Ruminococcus sp.]
MQKGTIRSIEYRLMIEGKPVYHALRLIRGIDSEDKCFILAVKNVDEEVRQRLAAQQRDRELKIYNQIAESLAKHYDTLYYVDMQDNEYFEYSSTDIYKSMQVPTSGSDFFKESEKNLNRFVHPEDRQRIVSFFEKENMLECMKNSKSYTTEYRLLIGEDVMYCRTSMIWASDKRHILVGIVNINEEIKAQRELEESKRQRTTYSQIVDSLASRYDTIYYVNINSGTVAKLCSCNKTDDPTAELEGLDFFKDSIKRVEQMVHENDRDRIKGLLDKDYIISTLENSKQYKADYRIVVDGRIEYRRITVMWADEKIHFIVGLENISEEVKREKEQIEALNRANDLARRDGLTGTRNMT